MISAGIATVLNRKHSTLQHTNSCTHNKRLVVCPRYETVVLQNSVLDFHYNSLLSRGTKFKNLFVLSYLALASLRGYLFVLLFLHTTHNPDTKPTLQDLLKFTCTDGRVINIPVEIGTKYVGFSVFLLDDLNGSRVKIMTHKHLNDAERINTEILQDWLAGKGKQPVTWATLVGVLRDIELSTLAGQIEAVKCPQDQSQEDLS